MKNQNISVTSKNATNQIRIVLEWGENPSDLDSHLLGMTSSGEQKFDIYYSDKTYSENGIIVVDLDLDDTSSYGPETTTIHKTTQDKYVFYVHRYAGSGTLSSSNAVVKVYVGNGLSAKYVYNVPNDQYGDYWSVFSYDTIKKKFSSINMIGNSAFTNY